MKGQETMETRLYLISDPNLGGFIPFEGTHADVSEMGGLDDE